MLHLLSRQRLPTIILTLLFIASEAMMLGPTHFVSAATITSASDVVTNESVSTVADHNITFTTSSGVSEGQTITITFPGDFDISSLTEDDVDISDDGIDLTTAATCAGSEQASVAIGGDVLTITICALDGGAIASPSVVVIEIGANATASGTGVNQIVNPNDGGTYLIAIGGSFADFGSIAVPIVAVGDLAVTATVSSSGGGDGGGGGSGEETDTTAPVISNVDLANITEDSATVTFDTDEDASCTVEYSIDNSYSSSASEASADTSHSIDLSALTSDTEYFYRITCEDRGGNSSSTESSFTTETDTAPGNVSNLSCSADDGEIGFSWTLPSDDDLAGIVLQCDTASYPLTPTDGDRLFSGSSSATSTTVSGLTNGTDYYCTVFTYDQGENYSSGALTTCRPSASSEATSADETTPSGATASETPSLETTDTETSGGETTVGGETTDTETSGGTSGGTTLPDGVPTGPEVSSGQGTSSTDVVFSADSVELTSENGSLTVIAEEPLTILVPSDSIEDKTVDSVYIIVDGQAYLIGQESRENGVDGYRATITTPTSGVYDATIHLVYTDGTTQDLSYSLEVMSPGYVYEIVEGAAYRVAGAVVTLMMSVSGDFEVIDIAESDTDGTFAWYVENGLYQVEISKAGYDDVISATFRVDNNIATALVRISRTPEAIVDILNSDSPPLEKITAVAQNLTRTIANILEEARDIPQVQVAADLAISAGVIVGLSTVAILASSFNLLPLLQYLMTSPILFIHRRKRKAWGVVYNAGTKLPIDLAIVRLYRLPTNTLVATRVTDKQGRYFFLVDPGTYRLVVVKPGYQFPSELLEENKEDGDYLDVYHGEIIEVTDRDATLAANIPLDPSTDSTSQNQKTITSKRVLRRLQFVLAILGSVFALAVLLIRPSLITALGLVLQLVIFTLSVRLTRPRKPKSWGIVYAADTGRTLSNTVVRIFEPKYNKLLETALTDSRGRYSFLVGRSQYFTTYEKTGFAKLEVRPIDKTNEKVSEVALDVKLETKK